MTEDVRQPFPRCDRCGDPWHGLPCAARKSSRIDGKWLERTCPCPSPYDDSYWDKEGE